MVWSASPACRQEYLFCQQSRRYSDQTTLCALTTRRLAGGTCRRTDHPNKLLLFGSQAKNTAGRFSDINLCVVVEVTNTRKLLADMYLNIESDVPFDLLLYSPDEWERCIADQTSFAYQIVKKGVMLYG